MASSKRTTTVTIVSLGNILCMGWPDGWDRMDGRLLTVSFNFLHFKICIKHYTGIYLNINV